MGPLITGLTVHITLFYSNVVLSSFADKIHIILLLICLSDVVEPSSSLYLLSTEVLLLCS